MVSDLNVGPTAAMSEQVKTNIKTEAARKRKATGVSRLQNAELVAPIMSWVEFSAGLPSNEEFHVFWGSIPFQDIICRKRSTDWKRTENA